MVNPTVFALLDDACAPPDEAASRLYAGHLDTLDCRVPEDFAGILARLKHALAQGRHALALFDYELGAALHDIAPRVGSDHRPLARILIFERCRRMASAEATAWLADRIDDVPAGIAGLENGVDETQYFAALAKIRAYQAGGHTYQINYTYRVSLESYGKIESLYARLRARQPTGYGALIALPDGGAVLSASPELFVQHRAGQLRVRPMKGTAAVDANPAVTRERAAWLAADPKNRAENLMIVDLMRNDLGRLAVPGSVRVPQLFAVEHYGDVLQMSSQVEARLREDVELETLLRALFPCGSITGAPKRRSMEIIRELEPDARGLYTGAIGWFDPPAAGERLGPFCLSVAIRTLELGPRDARGLRAGRLGVGGAIVYDSVPEDEYREACLKGRFATDLPQNFHLIETIFAERETGCRHLERHLDRLSTSARWFGFACDRDAIVRQLNALCATLPDGGPQRVRLLLSQNGDLELAAQPLIVHTHSVTVGLAEQRIASNDPFLRHKTTHRARYNDAMRAAETRGWFDLLFFNERGELCEGARSNVFIQRNGQWLTPALECGFLAGVMRGVLIEKLGAQAALLTRADLLSAQEIVVCNALHGALTARLIC